MKQRLKLTGVEMPPDTFGNMIPTGQQFAAAGTCPFGGLFEKCHTRVPHGGKMWLEKKKGTSVIY